MFDKLTSAFLLVNVCALLFFILAGDYKNTIKDLTYNDLACNIKNITLCIRHQCIKRTVLYCHRCLTNTGVEKMNHIKYRLEL